VVDLDGIAGIEVSVSSAVYREGFVVNRHISVPARSKAITVVQLLWSRDAGAIAVGHNHTVAADGRPDFSQNQIIRLTARDSCRHGGNAASNAKRLTQVHWPEFIVLFTVK
jgi:hypothetical protein